MLNLKPAYWLPVALVVAAVSFTLHISVTSGLFCGTTVPAEALLPVWIYTAGFIVECVGMVSVFASLATSVLLLRRLTSLRELASIVIGLFIGLSAILTVGWSVDWQYRYGGEILLEFLRNLSISISYALVMATVLGTLIAVRDRSALRG